MCETCTKIETIQLEDQLLYLSMILSRSPELLPAVEEYLAGITKSRLAERAAKRFNGRVNRRITKDVHHWIVQWTDELAERLSALVCLEDATDRELGVFFEGIPVARLRSREACQQELEQAGEESNRLAYNLIRFYYQFVKVARGVQEVLNNVAGRLAILPKKEKEPLVN